MSTDQSPSRSPSPDDVTSDTEADESFVVHLKDVKTVAELYESGVLKPASPTKLVFQAQQDLLDRVALWWGLLNQVATHSEAHLEDLVRQARRYNKTGSRCDSQRC